VRFGTFTLIQLNLVTCCWRSTTHTHKKTLKQFPLRTKKQFGSIEKRPCKTHSYNQTLSE